MIKIKVGIRGIIYDSMATIINTPGTQSESGSGVGVVVGVILAIVVLALLAVYGIPALRGTAPQNGTNIQVPDKIDVNVAPAAGNQ